MVDALESIDDTNVIVDISEKTTGNDTDQDQSALTYSITSGNDDNLFTINQSTGVIKLAATKSLDYATKNSHTLTVKAVAADSNAQEDTATVTINVKQPDTANPTIADATVTPLESIAAGTTIIDINDTSGNGSTDTDGDGKALTYSIIAGNENGLFAPNQSTGVTTGKSLDYETSPSHTLVVQAAESDGSGTDTAVITINVCNFNEHAPVIDDISVDALESIGDTDVIVDISENTTGNDTDQDQSALTYSITSGNDDNLFTINQSTGVIKLAATALIMRLKLLTH